MNEDETENFLRRVKSFFKNTRQTIVQNSEKYIENNTLLPAIIKQIIVEVQFAGVEEKEQDKEIKEILVKEYIKDFIILLCEERYSDELKKQLDHGDTKQRVIRLLYYRHSGFDTLYSKIVRIIKNMIDGWQESAVWKVKLTRPLEPMRQGEMRKTEEQLPHVLAEEIASYITGDKNKASFSRKSPRKSRKSPRKSARKSPRKSPRKSRKSARKSPRKVRKSPRKSK